MLGKWTEQSLWGLGAESMAPTATSAIELLEVEPDVRRFTIVQPSEGVLEYTAVEEKKKAPVIPIIGAIAAGLFFMGR